MRGGRGYNGDAPFARSGLGPGAQNPWLTV